MTYVDLPLFPTVRVCMRCGRQDVTDPQHDVCDYCLHLDHRPDNRLPTGAVACHWCAATESPSQAATNGMFAAADADPEFMHHATRALAVVRDTREPFTAAEVRAVLESWGVSVTGRNALGAVFASANAAGVIRANGDFVPSPVKGQHGRPLRVWVAA